jgi:hypothetical protein
VSANPVPAVFADQALGGLDNKFLVVGELVYSEKVLDFLQRQPRLKLDDFPLLNIYAMDVLVDDKFPVLAVVVQAVSII